MRMRGGGVKSQKNAKNCTDSSLVHTHKEKERKRERANKGKHSVMSWPYRHRLAVYPMKGEA